MLVAPRSRIGLLGPNGVGKSSLLRVSGGPGTNPTPGSSGDRPRSMTVGLLDQEPGAEPGERCDRSWRRPLASRAAADELQRPRGHDRGPRHDPALHGVPRSIRPARRSRLRVSVRPPSPPSSGSAPLDVRVDQLSGGQRTRAALAAIELAGSTCCCWTSPRTTWTPKGWSGWSPWCRGFAGGIVVVSHDRAFLDACVDRFLELDPFTRRASEFVGDLERRTWPIVSETATGTGRSRCGRR